MAASDKLVKYKPDKQKKIVERHSEILKKYCLKLLWKITRKSGKSKEKLLNTTLCMCVWVCASVCISWSARAAHLISYCILPHLSICLPLFCLLSPITFTLDYCHTGSSPDAHMQGTILLIWWNLSLIITIMIHCAGLAPVSHHQSVLSPSLASPTVALLLSPSGPSKW